MAVCLLFSFMNPAHEQRVRELVAEVLPDVQVYLSCETLPQIREYPRLTTTVVNAYVAPVVNRYIHRLEEALKSRRITRPLYIMQSNGGSLTGGALRNIPVRMIESGPAAGVLGAAYIGRMTDQLKVISFDMGGYDGKGRYHRRRRAAHRAALPGRRVAGDDTIPGSRGDRSGRREHRLDR